MLEPNFIGIDVSDRRIYAAMYNDAFEVLLEQEICTDQMNDVRGLFNKIESLIGQMTNRRTIGVGIGFPGLVSTKKEVVYKLSAINHEQPIDVQKLLSKIKLPIFIDNSVNLIALTELFMGEEDCTDLLVFAMGDCVGGGIVMQSDLLHGSDGVAGDFGNMIVQSGTKGNAISITDLCSGKAFVSRFNDGYANIAERAYSGDEEALSNWQEFATDVGLALANLVLACNPTKIILAGPVSVYSDLMLEQIDEVLQDRLANVQYKNLKVGVCEFSNPTAMGAAILVHALTT